VTRVELNSYPTESMTASTAMHDDFDVSAVVLVRSNADDAWLFLPVCSLFVAGLGYLTFLGPKGIAANHPNLDFNFGLIPFAFAFSVSLLLAKLYQCRWPTRYSAHIGLDTIAFYRSSHDDPDYIFHRETIASVRTRRRRWFHNPDMCEPIEFVGYSGDVTPIPVTYIWLGNRSEFLELVRKFWGPLVAPIKTAG